MTVLLRPYRNRELSQQLIKGRQSRKVSRAFAFPIPSVRNRPSFGNSLLYRAQCLLELRHEQDILAAEHFQDEQNEMYMSDGMEMAVLEQLADEDAELLYLASLGEPSVDEPAPLPAQTEATVVPLGLDSDEGVSQGTALSRCLCVLGQAQCTTWFGRGRQPGGGQQGQALTLCHACRKLAPRGICRCWCNACNYDDASMCRPCGSGQATPLPDADDDVMILTALDDDVDDDPIENASDPECGYGTAELEDKEDEAMRAAPVART